MTTLPPQGSPEANQRMTDVFRLYEDLVTAAGVSPQGQQIDLLFLQALYQASDEALQGLRDVIAATAQLRAALLTADQVAERLHIKPKLVKQLAKLGVLNGYQSARGGRWRFTEKALEDFSKLTDRKALEHASWHTLTAQQ